jgi:hypothetical protein
MELKFSHVDEPTQKIYVVGTDEADSLLGLVVPESVDFFQQTKGVGLINQANRGNQSVIWNQPDSRDIKKRIASSYNSYLSDFIRTENYHCDPDLFDYFDMSTWGLNIISDENLRGEKKMICVDRQKLRVVGNQKLQFLTDPTFCHTIHCIDFKT